MKRYVLGAAALALSMAAHADAYIGAAIGPSSMDINCNFSCDDGDTGFKIYGGLPLKMSGLPSLSLEVGYIDFGKASDRINAGGLAGARHDLEVSALTVAGALRYNFTPALAGVGRLGLGYVEGKTSVTANVLSFGVTGSDSNSDLNLYFGFGLEYNLNRQWKLTGTADFTSYDTGRESGDASMFAIGLQYGF